MRQTAKAHIWPFFLALAIVGAWNLYGKVIWFATGEVTERTPSLLKMHVTAYKLRDCQVVPGSQIGYILPKHGQWQEADFQFVDDKTPGNSKPRLWFQRQSFGIWRWDKHLHLPDIESVMATVVHNCGETLSAENLPAHIEEFQTTVIGPLSATGPIVR